MSTRNKKTVTEVIEENKEELVATHTEAPSAPIPVNNAEKNRLAGIGVNLRTADAKRHRAAKEYMREDKVNVSISPMYRPHFGSTAHISVNGISVYIPVNGRTYSVNKTHAAAIYEALRKIDDSVERTKRMAEVKGNVESSPGQLKF